MWTVPILIAAIVAVGFCDPEPGVNPVAKYIAPSHSNIQRNEDVFGNYNFNYDVADGHTGDVHSRGEKKHGHGVTGTYTLGDPNGYVRKVDYVSDDYHGTRQAVYGSENGLYVASPGYKIVPNAVPVAHKVVTAPVVKPIVPPIHDYDGPHGEWPHGISYGYGAPVAPLHGYGGRFGHFGAGYGPNHGDYPRYIYGRGHGHYY